MHTTSLILHGLTLSGPARRVELPAAAPLREGA